MGVAEVTMSNEDTAGQWIAELFQPAFSFAVDDVAALQEEGPIKSKIKRAPAFDPEAIQKVYEKVRVMNILDAEMKQQTWDREIAELTAQKTDSHPQEEVDKKDRRDDTKESDEDSGSAVDLKESCIWDTDELDVLRKVYKSAKGRIKELEVEVRETQRRNKLLEDDNIMLKSALEVTESGFKDAKKANKRLKIHCDNLKEQLEFASAKVDAVTEMWKEISEEKSSMMKETQDLRIQTDRERLVRERLEIKVEEAGREIIQEKKLAQENARVKYETMIFGLQKHVKSLSDDLTKERQSHDISKKALTSLRHHFASLPLHDIIAPHVVQEDQVKNIDYLSL
ncbi:tropomyosin-like isoform X2 [Haliotis cracherodii]|uniref:tropomyosin-like isoform X2 n=1 Tax=Haliotis cracherodii TaxID=6455 RepID=UPI0039E77F8E